MLISLKWLNRYLNPGDVSAEEADQLLTQAGLPIETLTELPTGDTLLDVEVTSNRGDCLSHIGCAREIAAMRGASRRRELVLPEPGRIEHRGQVRDVLTLENREHEHCPLFTAQVIRGCRIGPSPDWLVEALESIGQRSINNVVDVTNFITFEFGNPCHVFDLAKLRGGALVIRFAHAGERLVTLDGKDRELIASDLVVADAVSATSLAGVIGGQASEVDARTTDVVFEMATWNPVTVRTTARRLGIRTDAGYRFERGVHPTTIETAALRAISLICELTGGVACQGVLREGPPLPEPVVVQLRPTRVEQIMGSTIPAGDMIAILRDLDIDVSQVGDDELVCKIPPHRLDLTREIDLVEEVARARGLDAVDTLDCLRIRPRSLQNPERAMREVGSILVGLGFYETITFSFVRPEEAEMFLPQGLKRVEVDDDRRKAEPALRPSVLSGLLTSRRANRDGGVDRPGGLRLFEIASTFAQTAGKESIERRTLALLLDCPKAKRIHTDDELRRGVRLMRGAIDAVLLAMFGPSCTIRVEPSEPQCPAWSDGTFATIKARVAGKEEEYLGHFGLLSDETLAMYGLEVGQVGAELLIEPLIAHFPPVLQATRLPQFPSIERDLSFVLDEEVRWSHVEELVRSAQLNRLVETQFVGTFRSEPIGKGRKSLTLRLSFRDPNRTMRHEEVDDEIERLVGMARTSLGAEIRA